MDEYGPFKFYVVDSCPPDKMYLVAPSDAAKILSVDEGELIDSLDGAQPVFCYDEEKARRLFEAKEAAARAAVVDLREASHD